MKPNRAPNKHNNLNKKILAQESRPQGNMTQRWSLRNSAQKNSVLQQYLGDTQ